LIKTVRAGDIASGLALAVIGTITLVASTRIAAGASGRLHPRTLPVTLGIVLLAGGGWLIVRARSMRDQDRTVEWPDPAGWRTWGIALAMMSLYAALMQPLGFLLATAIFVAAFIWYFGRHKIWVALAWSCGTAGFLYGLFIWLLQMGLPAGPFGF
jgi:putative tricarboxylic transport membrane protein